MTTKYKTALEAAIYALRNIRDAEDNGNKQDASDLLYYLERAGFEITLKEHAK